MEIHSKFQIPNSRCVLKNSNESAKQATETEAVKLQLGTSFGCEAADQIVPPLLKRVFGHAKEKLIQNSIEANEPYRSCKPLKTFSTDPNCFSLCLPSLSCSIETPRRIIQNNCRAQNVVALNRDDVARVELQSNRARAVRIRRNNVAQARVG